MGEKLKHSSSLLTSAKQNKKYHARFSCQNLNFTVQAVGSPFSNTITTSSLTCTLHVHCEQLIVSLPLDLSLIIFLY